MATATNPPLAPFEMAEVRKFAMAQAVDISKAGGVQPLDPTKVIALADRITKWITTGSQT